MEMLECEAGEALDAIRGEGRKSARFPMRSLVRACWIDADGAVHHLPAQGLDLSPGGAAFVVAEAFPAGAVVHLELPFSRLSAQARVRNCERLGASWRVGVKLDGGFAGIA